MTNWDVGRPPAPIRDDGLAEPSAKLSEIVVLVPSDRVRAWVLRLADVLQQHSGLPTRLLRAPWVARSRGGMSLEGLERQLFAAAPSGHADWVATESLDVAEHVRWSEALLVNATERDHSSFPAALRESVILTPTFHGLCGADGFLRPLLSGEAPHLGVLLSTGDTSRLVQGARMAAPERVIMHRALHLVFGRLITLLVGAVEHVLTGRRLPEPSQPPLEAHRRTLDLGWRLTGAGLSRLGRGLRKPAVRFDWWCFGVRRLQRDCSPIDLSLEPATFQIPETGPDRFYADPFLLQHDGVTAAFFEDFDYSLGRGSISCFVLDAQGRPGASTLALRRPYHLSYPFVFVHDGVPLMIPETSGNGTIELYEATRFPDEWRLRAVLMDNIQAADSTVYFDRQNELWWMFSTVSEFDSSSYDTLSIFYSERLDGPWRPHAGNPVKFDPSCSRPAGPLLPWKGRLFRPTQDCTRTYGGSLVWCEISRLTPSIFCEQPVARQQPPRGHTGLHTYGRAAGFEVVDFKRNRSRLAGRERFGWRAMAPAASLIVQTGFS